MRGGMPKSKSTSKKDGAQSASIAIELGRKQAADVIALRARQRNKRKRAIADVTKELVSRRAFAVPEIPERTLRALGSNRSAGVLIAEGDSWFDYPLNDVLSLLEDDHGYDVESVAHKGDRVEDIAYSGGQFEEFTRRLEKLLRQGRVPNAILLSGGGNDIAGDELALLLNHAASGLPVINDDVVRGVVDVRLRNAYEFLVSGLTEITRQFLDRPIPILTHGYDYPVPDGRGFLGGLGFLPGPWLRPGFHRKGHGDQPKNTTAMRDLIDRFNGMLQQLSSTPQFRHVHFVDLRNTLSSDPKTYRQHWANELHPTPRGFTSVTDKIAAAIAGL
jgi:lysophospholipase L1-like esterase